MSLDGNLKDKLAVSFSDEFSKKYNEYIAQREVSLAEIREDQMKLLDGLVDNVDEFRDNLLNKIDEQLLKDIQVQSEGKLDLLEQQKSNVKEYMAELKEEYDKVLESGNTELARELAEKYNEALMSSLKIEQDINKAIKQRYDMEFALIDKKIAKENQIQDTYRRQIEILKELYAYNYDGFIKHNEAILQSEVKKLEVLKQSSEELQKQLKLLEVGSNEWNIVNDRLESINDSVLDVTLSIIRQNKEVLRNKYDRELKNLESSIFGGMTQDEAREQLDDKINAQNKYVDGLEKELLIAKLLSSARKNDVALTAEELNMLNQAGKIERDKLGRLEKQLGIRMLEQKITNLKNQKTIQQLAKKADGTWDYTYVTDQDAIEKAEDELKDAKLDLIKFDQEVLNKQQREELDSKSKHFNKLKEALDKSLRAEYESKEVFYNDLQNLVGEFLEFLDVDVSDSMDNLFEMFELFIEKLGAVGDGLGNFKPPVNSSGAGGFVYPNGKQYHTSSDWAVHYDGDIDRSNLGFLDDINFLQVGQTSYNMDYARENAEQMDKIIKNLAMNGGYYISDSGVKNAFTGKDYGGVGTSDAYSALKEGSDNASKEIEKIKKKLGFARGGETHKTGLHWLDGKVGEPERILSGQQTKDFNKLVANMPDLLKMFDGNKFEDVLKSAVLSTMNVVVPKIPNMQLAGNSGGDQIFHIDKVEFPNITTADEATKAMLNLPNRVKQRTRIIGVD